MPDAARVMLWRWFWDWRKRRSTLAEINGLQLYDEAVLMDQNENPINLARMSVVSDPEEAAAQWERAQRQVPNAVVMSDDSLHILLSLKRYDEADALMWQRRRRLPGDQFSLTGLAQIAEQRGDIVEALERWGAVRARVRDSVDGYLGCARCLAHFGRYGEAEIQLKHAHRRDPYSHDVRVARARLSDQRKDWEESILRWKLTAETVQDAPAFALVAKAMIELGRLDEAETYLAGPSLRFPSDLEIAMTRCQIAQLQGDLTAACQRWATVRAINPQSHAAYHEGSRRLFEVGRYAEADGVLRTAIDRFPDEIWPFQDFAEMAHDRCDWEEAAIRWAALRHRFPTVVAGVSRGAAALRSAGRHAEAAALEREV